MIDHCLKLISEAEDDLYLLMRMHDDQNREMFARFIRGHLNRLRKELELNRDRTHQP